MKINWDAKVHWFTIPIVAAAIIYVCVQTAAKSEADLETKLRLEQPDVDDEAWNAHVQLRVLNRGFLHRYTGKLGWRAEEPLLKAIVTANLSSDTAVTCESALGIIKRSAVAGQSATDTKLFPIERFYGSRLPDNTKAYADGLFSALYDDPVWKYTFDVENDSHIWSLTVDHILKVDQSPDAQITVRRSTVNTLPDPCKSIATTEIVAKCNASPTIQIGRLQVGDQIAQGAAYVLLLDDSNRVIEYVVLMSGTTPVVISIEAPSTLSEATANWLRHFRITTEDGA